LLSLRWTWLICAVSHPGERARTIIENCTHPIYRDELRFYFERALKRGGHTPHLLEEAFSWHDAYRKRGAMKDARPEQMAHEAVAH
jgi:succinyl-CoA:acetate CoA-transferase